VSKEVINRANLIKLIALLAGVALVVSLLGMANANGGDGVTRITVSDFELAEEPTDGDRMCVRLDLQGGGRSGRRTFRHCASLTSVAPMTTAFALDCERPRRLYIFGFIDSQVRRVGVSGRTRRVRDIQIVESPSDRPGLYVIALEGRFAPRSIRGWNASGELMLAKRLPRSAGFLCPRDGLMYGTYDG